MAHGSAATSRHLNLLDEYDFLGRKAAGQRRNPTPKIRRLNGGNFWGSKNKATVNTTIGVNLVGSAGHAGQLGVGAFKQLQWTQARDILPTHLADAFAA